MSLSENQLRTFKSLLLSLAVVVPTVSLLAQDVAALEWPREIEAKDHLITMYQPQLETLKDNVLEGRAALSVKDSKDEMTFGTLWFKARLSTDKQTRIAVLEGLEIPIVKFPSVEDTSKLEALKRLLIDDFENADIEMSIDRIIATVEKVNERDESVNDLNNTPPTIYFRTKPTVLVSVDGDPIMKEAPGGDGIEYVVNTPFFLVKKKSYYYLKGGEYWYRAKEVTSSSWEETTFVPDDVKKLAKESIQSEEEAPDEEEDAGAPDIVISTKPAEMLVSDGEPAYKPIDNTELLYVENTENDIIMDTQSQNHFILVNGRWYTSKTLKDGSWEFTEPDKLPGSFASIPDSSSVASVRSSVPGTPEAEEARIEQYIPQTAVVDRKTATVEVTYDGEPKFESIEGTSMTYAVNTASTVLFSNGKYYCVDDGIWFESSQAKGPWKVSDSRPTEVDDIPASSPVNNVKYVYVYDSTPDVVYVGYTPGYYHSYMYGGMVVYGTGYHYRPWYGAHYYPRPVTYGYSVHYNPYTGWGFSVGVSYGWLTVSSGGYWGPAGYSHGYRHGYHHGYHRGYHNGYRAGYARGRYEANNVYRNRPSGVRQTGGARNGGIAGNRRPKAGGNGRVSGSQQSRPKTAQREQPGGNRNLNSKPSAKPNNMYADRQGNVHQRDKYGNWQQQTSGPRKSNAGQTPQSRPQTRPQQGQSRAQPNMERSYQQRSRSNTRTNGYNQYRATPSNRAAPSRGAGGARPTPSRSGGRRR